MNQRQLSTAGLLLVAIFGAAHADACAVAGRVDGLLLEKIKVTRLDVARMSIAREGTTLAVDDGMPVCEDDLITARAGVVANVRIGDNAEKDNIITLNGEAVITVEDTSGITASLGRIFALLRGKFDVRLSVGTLAARGTQFEVNATAGQMKVVQLEGEVEVKADVPGAAPSLKPLQELDLSASGAKPRPITPAFCSTLTDAHSAVISGTRPELPFEVSGRNADRESIARDFAAARKGVLCDGQAGAAPELARAWANYAEPGGVLKLIEAVPPPANGDQAAIYANSAGNAYRQIGEGEAALSWYQRALAQNPRFAFPFNGIGDVHRDRGLAAIGNRKLDEASSEFDQAQKWYEDSLDRNLEGKADGINRAIPMVNLGELALQRIAAEPARSAELLELARQWLERAQATAGGYYAFTELGLARLDLMRAAAVPDVVLEGPSGNEKIILQGVIDFFTISTRDRFTSAAERRLNALLEKYPDFSAAALLRGEVKYQSGKRNEAKIDFRAAIRFDPHNVLAYLKLTEALTSRKERAERALYESALKSAAYPALMPVLEGRAKLAEAARPKPQVRDMRALSPSVPTVTFGSRHEGQSEKVTFTNTSAATVTVGEISITGNDAQAFAVAPQGCLNRQLAAKATCDVEVRFVGSRERDWSAKLVVGNSGGVNAEVALKAVVKRLRNSE